MSRMAQLRVFLIFSAAYFLSYFYRSANAIIAPDLRRELGLTAGQLGLMTSLFFAAFAAAQIPLGLGLDAVGPRWMTPALMLVGMVGSLIFASGHSFLVLAVGRALIGVGMAGILMGALKMFSRWFSTRRFATVSSLLVGIGSSGALAAATPLAWFNAAFGWRTVFGFGALLVALVALTIVVGTRNAPPDSERPAESGSAGHFGDIFLDLRFWRIAPLAFFTHGVILAFQGLWAGPYLFDVYAMDRISGGNFLLLLSLGATIGFTACGWLADRFGLARVVVVGAGFFVAAQVILALQPPLWGVGGVFVIFGVCGGFSLLLLTQPRLIFPASITGRATTATNLFAIGGTFILQWLMGEIIGAFPVNAAGHYPPAAFAAALFFTSVGTALALLWYWPMVRGERA